MHREQPIPYLARGAFVLETPKVLKANWPSLPDLAGPKRGLSYYEQDKTGR
jgi:hypothetical protein